MDILFHNVISDGVLSAVFAAESQKNVYEILVFPDGDEKLRVNCKPVEKLPDFCQTLRRVADGLKEKTLEFLSLPEGNRRNALWWFIKDKTENNE